MANLAATPPPARAKTLMIAYACNPEGTGEHWLGWGWAEQAVRRYDVHLITTPNHQTAVSAQAQRCGITTHFVAPPDWLRNTSLHLGSFGSWLRKFAWQWQVQRLAHQLHAREHFALVHQTTFHTFRVPFLALQLGIPSVWGPVAGGESIPPGFGKTLGAGKLSEHWRRWVNRAWLLYPPVHHSLTRCSHIFVSNQTTLRFLPRWTHAKCTVVPPNALSPEDEQAPPHPAHKRAGATLRLLYVGNCVPTRALPLIFAALRAAAPEQFKLSIVGTGPALAFWRQEAVRLNVSQHVEFVGKVPKTSLPAIYENADLLVFPALRDSGGSALLEAMARGLPVLCLDWGGPGEMVDQTSGIKIPITNLPETISAIARALQRAHRDPAWCAALATAARQRARAQFSWEAKARQLNATYDQLLSAS